MPQPAEQQEQQPSPPAAAVVSTPAAAPQQQQQQAVQQSSQPQRSSQLTETPQVVVDRMFKRVITFAGLPVVTGMMLFPVFWYLRVRRICLLGVQEWCGGVPGLTPLQGMPAPALPAAAAATAAAAPVCEDVVEPDWLTQQLTASAAGGSCWSTKAIPKPQTCAAACAAHPHGVSPAVCCGCRLFKRLSTPSGWCM
jgi:hypothetical protein